MVAINKGLMIENIIENKVVQQSKRACIGASGLGNRCHRKIWLDFRWFYDSVIPARVARLFAHGDYEEIQVKHDLEMADVNVYGEQLEFVDETGHIKGHVDGLVSDLPDAPSAEHLLEIKTMNDARFKDYIKNGLKETNIGYWVQIQMYMGWAKLKRCLFIVVNKNTDERHYERYRFDQDTFNLYSKIAFDILTSESPPEKIGNKTYIDCKFCNAKCFCHEGEPALINCRTCKNADIENHGKWACGLTGLELSYEEQLRGCGLHVPIA